MTNAKSKFDLNMSEGYVCLQNYDAIGHDFALRHIWIAAISAFELYMTELVSEAGLKLIDKTPPILTPSLRQVQVPLEKVLEIGQLSPTEKLLFYQRHVYSEVQYKSFYRPEKVSEALGYIWTSPAKEKWSRILSGMKSTGRHQRLTEQNLRDELTLISDRRDLIAHSVDTVPGASTQNPVSRPDAVRVIEFIGDLAMSIDRETELQNTH